MRTYLVAITSTMCLTVAVNADSADDALDKAQALPSPPGWEASHAVQLVALDLRGNELCRAR